MSDSEVLLLLGCFAVGWILYPALVLRDWISWQRHRRRIRKWIQK